MKYALIGILTMLSACTGQVAKQSEREQVPLTEAHLATVEAEQEIGKEVFRKDGYAAKATDYLFDQGILPDDRRSTGWVVDLRKDIPAVYFMGPGPNGLKSYHVVLFTEKGLKHAVNPETLPIHQSMFQARMLGLDSIKLPCSDRYNTVVIDAGDNWLVYVLAATTEPGIMVAGGHHRVTVTKDDHTVLDVKPLSKACLELPIEPDTRQFLTHIVDPTPIATHSFLSLLHNKTIYVATETGSWKVENGDISPME